MRHRSGHAWLLVPALCLIVAGCAAPNSVGPDGEAPGQSSNPGDGTGSGNLEGSSDPGGFPTEGPITITIDGKSFGYELGRCEVIDDVVYARAEGFGREDHATFAISMMELTLPEWDREIAHVHRTGSIRAVIPNDAGGISSELTAGRGDPGTTWDWTVSGSRVEVSAVMGDRTTAARADGAETFVDYYDVTITMDCTGTFGVGAGVPDEPMHEDFRLEEAPTDRVPGSVTVELEGTTYDFSYLTACPLFSNDVSAESTSDEAYVWFYSEGVGVMLDFEIGDRRDEKAVERWMLPPNASLQSDFPFSGSGTTRTWTGDVVSEAGGEAEMTISVECSEGDAFDPAGAVSLVVDGVAYDIDEVVTCTIDGTAVEFFGRQSVGSAALVVTSGGTEILFANDSGQTVTSGVTFTINGQQATWSGTLADNRPASVTIDCG